ncbi:YgfZ/GcvT domain-containing protein [Mesorhizobium sp. AaZ16]|uniref:CAF17-like 4Fe-4S cluster assembly/insertion protein YgfZ n=1 Tax=Mesorhizobium sp. AaZ16 TaxID=3402289 RepID=UPI00374F7F4E
MPTAQLDDRALISVSGADAEHFLQNIVTADLDALPAGEAKPGALLTPQGKILFDFLISRDGETGFILECRGDVADDFVRRLMLYRLRAKVDISVQDQALVSVRWQDASEASASDSSSSQTESTGLRDLRFPAPAQVTRHYGQSTSGDVAAWHAFRISHGIAESGADYQLSDAFPHDILLDQMGGIGFRKGCYVGQEVVSRMQHRGTARRRTLIASTERALPPSGTDVLADGRSIGTLGSVAGSSGLAIVRIDKVKAAMDEGVPILAGGVPLSLAIPPWATFSFPQETAAAGDA